MDTFKKKLIFRIAITVIGIVAGLLYWKFVGCASGTCMIKSKWYFSSLYGGIFGYLISGLFIKDKPKETTETEIKD